MTGHHGKASSGERFGVSGDAVEFLKVGNSWNVLARTELLLG